MRWRAWLVAGLVLVGFGILRMPFEEALDEAQQAVGLRQTTLDLDLRERVGQMGFLAALSGFRSPLAAILWIEAHTAWEQTEWGRMAALFDTVTTLQPRSRTYWDMAAWHMAWNASVAALDDKNVQSEALRQRNAKQYILLGKDILERGIRNNPESAFLHERMGVLLRDKLEDFCGSADAFERAANLPGSMPYVRRFVGYMLAKCPGREREAYDWLRRLYDEGPQQRLPTLLTTLKELEKRLDVPADQQIPSHE